jgi:hypothetical protein
VKMQRPGRRIGRAFVGSTYCQPCGWGKGQDIV